MPSKLPTRYAVICPTHDQVYLTRDEYNDQISHPDDFWVCPICGRPSVFDDDNYEKSRLEDRLAPERDDLEPRQNDTDEEC